MAYRLENGEPVADGVRRCAREQLDRAIEELTVRVEDDPVDAVHSARKALKKERSLLRLCRSGLDREQRRSQAAELGRIAKRLGAARDSDVMIEALDDLAERYAGQVPRQSFTALRRRLVTQQSVERQQLAESERIRAVVDDLEAARARIDDWRIRHDGWPLIGDGLVRSYRRGHRAFKVARADPSSENFHNWRKRSKDLWYQLRVIRPLAPANLRGHARPAHHLSDVLGDHHDLWVLETTLKGSQHELKVDVEPVFGLIEHRRAQLETEARFLGDRVYAETPKAFRRRIRRYWKAWRAEIKAIDSARPESLADATKAPALT